MHSITMVRRSVLASSDYSLECFLERYIGAKKCMDYSLIRYSPYEKKLHDSPYEENLQEGIEKE